MLDGLNKFAGSVGNVDPTGGAAKELPKPKCVMLLAEKLVTKACQSPFWSRTAAISVGSPRAAEGLPMSIALGVFEMLVPKSKRINLGPMPFTANPYQ